MKLLEFIRNWMNTRWERKSYCKSCEILKEQLALANHDKRVLMERFVLTKPEMPAILTETPQAIQPKIVPWRVQRELLEAEDRAKAATIRRQQEDAKKANKTGELSDTVENHSISVSELEKELGVQ